MQRVIDVELEDFLDFGGKENTKGLDGGVLSGAVLSILAALVMVFLFGMKLSAYLSTTTSTSVVVDRSRDGDYLRIDFNLSFPALSCEFASVDVSDVLGTERLRSETWSACCEGWTALSTRSH